MTDQDVDDTVAAAAKVLKALAGEAPKQAEA
jgi:hypothetical protein